MSHFLKQPALMLLAVACVYLAVAPASADEQGGDVKRSVFEHEPIIAHYECEQKNIVAVGDAPATKDFKPFMDPHDCSYDDCNRAKFEVDVIAAHPNERCSTDYYDKQPFIKWLLCYAKFAIAFDGNKQVPRSYSLHEMRSDNGHVFYGQGGGYLRIDGVQYSASYDGDSGDDFLEVGTCKKRE